MDTNEPLLDTKQQQFPPIRQKGHYRSSSLENNTYLATSATAAAAAAAAAVGILGVPKTNALPNTNYTGTLKSRREQKRITDFLNKQQNNQNDLNSRKAHFENIREIFEKNKLNQGTNIKLIIKNDSSCNKLGVNGMNGMGGVGIGLGNGNGGCQSLDGTNNNYLDDENKPPKIQSCSGILGKVSVACHQGQ